MSVQLSKGSPRIYHHSCTHYSLVIWSRFPELALQIPMILYTTGPFVQTVELHLVDSFQKCYLARKSLFAFANRKHETNTTSCTTDSRMQWNARSQMRTALFTGLGVEHSLCLITNKRCSDWVQNERQIIVHSFQEYFWCALQKESQLCICIFEHAT